VTPGKFSNVLRRAFFYLLILPAYESVLDTACSLGCDNSSSGTRHRHVVGRGFALEMSEDAVALVAKLIIE